MTFVDTNVLLDLVTRDRVWVDWSVAWLDAATLSGPCRINEVVYAELAVRYERIEHLDAFIEKAALTFVPMPRPALFLAAKAFGRYRAAGGPRMGVLPDFFIGAHAAVEGWPLLTRDVRRYRTYFPTLEIIAPEV